LLIFLTINRSHAFFTAQCTLVQSAVLQSHVVIVVRPSVRLSVTLVDCDHIGWKSWKLIARTISPTPSLSAAKWRSTHSQGNMGEFCGDKRWGKSGMLENKSGSISETHKDRGKVTVDGLFRTVPSSTPYGLPFPKIGGSQPPLKTAI